MKLAFNCWQMIKAAASQATKAIEALPRSIRTPLSYVGFTYTVNKVVSAAQRYSFAGECAKQFDACESSPHYRDSCYYNVRRSNLGCTQNAAFSRVEQADVFVSGVLFLLMAVACGYIAVRSMASQSSPKDTFCLPLYVKGKAHDL